VEIETVGLDEANSTLEWDVDTSEPMITHENLTLHRKLEKIEPYVMPCLA
jgi:hypothetical protein